VAFLSQGWPRAAANKLAEVSDHLDDSHLLAFYPLELLFGLARQDGIKLHLDGLGSHSVDHPLQCIRQGNDLLRGRWPPDEVFGRPDMLNHPKPASFLLFLLD